MTKNIGNKKNNKKKNTIKRKIIKKIFFIAGSLIKKIKKFSKKTIIKTWSRASIILPFMKGYTFALHNGTKNIPLFILKTYFGRKLGTLVKTRFFQTHIKADKKQNIKNKQVKK